MKTTTLRVLIVEDSADDFSLLLRELNKSNFEIEYILVEDSVGFKNALSQNWDIIISDYALPGFTGNEALKICNKRKLDTPFIMVSGTVGEDIAVEMMRAGARDYIMKNSLKRLLPAIERELNDAKVRDEHKKTEIALHASEHLYHNLFQKAHEGFMVIDKEGKIKDFNEAIAKMHGFSTNEFKVLNISELQLNKKDIFEEHSELSHHDLSKDMNRIEIEHRHKDGHALPLIITLSKIDANNELYLAFYQDITDRKKAEAAVQRKIEDLLTFNKMAVGRELKMVELKKEINELLKEMGKEKRYDV